MAEIKINQQWCKGCGFCVEICPKDVYARDSKVSPRGFQEVIIKAPEKCIECQLCEYLCPDLAITVIGQKTAKLQQHLTTHENNC